MKRVKYWLRKGCTAVFPALKYYRTARSIDRESRVSEYSDKIENTIDSSEGDFDDLVDQAEEAHRSEIDRSTDLDSKAGNYLGNVGVVLSILSLAVAIGIEQYRNLEWPETLVLLSFGYAVIALLWSAYYSSKALKMRGYSAYFTADEMQEWIENGIPDNTETVSELLVCKKHNEQHNLEKNNAISVAESFSRNGLIAIGIGLGLVILLALPTETIL
ncbi:hypothetical protein [Halostella pelagica]|uniref:hypothetical protein n=1 Tax=Halostella pelagica TaxID=2583824 RepID=UPI0010802313|nr:hypothetical protein [Halostella pelagica]